jgi:hypothetical protein
LEIETVSNNQKFRFVDSQIPISTNSNIHFVRLDYVNYTSSESMNQIYALNYTICESNCTRDSNCLGFGFKYGGLGYCVFSNRYTFLNRYTFKKCIGMVENCFSFRYIYEKCSNMDIKCVKVGSTKTSIVVS